MHPQTIRDWLRRYAKEGEALFQVSLVRGHPSPNLSPEQEAWMKKAMTEHAPQALGLEGSWWTPPLVQALAKKQFDVSLGDSTTYTYLHRWGFRPRVPLRRAIQRNPESIREWLDTTWPGLVKRVANGAELVFLDESQVREDHVQPRVWVPTSARPAVDVSGKRGRVNVISAVQMEGKLWWWCYTETLESTRFCEALSRLYREMGSPKELLVVLDGLRVHFSEETTQWLQEHLPQVSLIRLPAYCPELNPDEQVWAYLKGILYRFSPLKIGEAVAEAVIVEMDRLQKAPERIRQFFWHPDLAYLHPLAEQKQAHLKAA